MATTHPNPELHKVLRDAAKQGKLTPEFVQKAAKRESLPTMERDASAYVNWNTTLSLLGRAPAKAWFAGVSNCVGPLSSLTQGIVVDVDRVRCIDLQMYSAQDRLRDDLSVGVYYWWIDYQLPATSCFWVEAFEPENILLIEVYDGYDLFALFVGTPTMNVQIQGGEHAFGGEGRWGRAK